MTQFVDKGRQIHGKDENHLQVAFKQTKTSGGADDMNLGEHQAVLFKTGTLHM